MDINRFLLLRRNHFGAHSVRETPVPIPNTVVKPHSGYNTWPIKAWENSTVPNYDQDLLFGRSFSFKNRCMGFLTVNA